MLQTFTLGTFAQGVSGGGDGAFESIASATGTGSSGTITFSSIPGTYQHLQIRYIARGTSATNGFTDLFVRFNNVTTTNYTKHGLRGNGSTTVVYGTVSQAESAFEDGILLNGTTATCYSVGIIDIHNYAKTSQYKTIRALFGSDSNSNAGTVGLHSGSLYSTTNAITRIDLICNGTNFDSSSQFALYGIKGA